MPIAKYSSDKIAIKGRIRGTKEDNDAGKNYLSLNGMQQFYSLGKKEIIQRYKFTKGVRCTNLRSKEV